MEHRLLIKSLHDAMAECSCGGWSRSFTGPTLKAEIQREHIRHVRSINAKPTAEELERELRESWDKRGIPKERQDEILKDLEEKAKPGAQIGPFRIPE